MGKKKTPLNALENFSLSGIAAVISKTTAAPIERVKLMIQNQDEMLKQGVLDKPYKGPIDCFRRVIAEEGVAPLWRGNLANCLRYFPTQALNFAFKERIKLAFNIQKTDHRAMQLLKNVGAGGSAGALSLMFVYSLDYARTRLANDLKSTKKGGGDRKYAGLIDVYKQTMKTDGVAGLYRGFVVSCIGIMVYRGFYFGIYDTVRPLIPKFGNEGTDFLVSFSVGYAVTVSAGLLSYPIDTIRRRMMMTSGQAVKYNGSWDCTQQILRNEGVQSLFKGAGANILRGMAGAGTLAGFDMFTNYYIKLKYGDDSAQGGAKTQN